MRGALSPRWVRPLWILIIAAGYLALLWFVIPLLNDTPLVLLIIPGGLLVSMVLATALRVPIEWVFAARERRHLSQLGLPFDLPAYYELLSIKREVGHLIVTLTLHFRAQVSWSSELLTPALVAVMPSGSKVEANGDAIQIKSHSILIIAAGARSGAALITYVRVHRWVRRALSTLVDIHRQAELERITLSLEGD